MLAQKGEHPDMVALLKANGVIVPPPEIIPRNTLGQAIARLPLHLLPNNKASAPITFSLQNSSSDHTPPTLLVKKGAQLYAAPVRFDTLFPASPLWPLDERGYVYYQVHQNYYTPDAYGFFGLVTTHRGTFLGLYWYTPADADRHQTKRFVLSLRVIGPSLELTILRASWRVNDGESETGPSPVLRQFPVGELEFIFHKGRFQYQPNGKWRKVGPTPHIDEKTGRYQINASAPLSRKGQRLKRL